MLIAIDTGKTFEEQSQQYMALYVTEYCGNGRKIKRIKKQNPTKQ